MVLPLQAQAIPLRWHENGRMILVGETRVPLETIVDAYNEGSTPEEIAMRYSAVALAHIYQVIGYYLEHRAEVDAYVTEAQAHHDAVEAQNRARFPMKDIRERLQQTKRR
jgi:uncharacterized protein (DUF433 family)